MENQNDTVQTPQLAVPSVQPQKLPTALVTTGIVVLFILGLASAFYLGKKSNPPSQPTIVVSPTPSTLSTEEQPEPTTTLDEIKNWKTHSYPDFKLTFKAPANLHVKAEGVQAGFALYVQNWPIDGVYPGTGAYQLYGIFQDGETDLEKDREMLIDSTIHYRTVDEHRAIQGQIKGERNRFYTAFIWKPWKAEGKFALFTSDPNQENEVLTDKILSTFKLTQ